MSAAPFTSRATPTTTASASTPRPGHANTTTPRAIQPAPTSHRYADDRSAGEDRVSAPVSRALMPVSRTKTAAEVNGRNVRTAPTTTHGTATVTTSQAGNRDNRRAGHRDTKRLNAGTVAVCHRPASSHRSQASGLPRQGGNPAFPRRGSEHANGPPGSASSSRPTPRSSAFTTRTAGWRRKARPASYLSPNGKLLVTARSTHSSSGPATRSARSAGSTRHDGPGALPTVPRETVPVADRLAARFRVPAQDTRLLVLFAH
jgi:hypothetical protein